MYKPFKALLARPTGETLIDRFQRDVVETLRAFVLSIFSKTEVGLVPAPGTSDGSQTLLDYGWGPTPSGGGGAGPPWAESDVTNLVTDLANRALTSTTITGTSPITGGGDLSASRTLGFDSAASLDNNARIAVRKNTGAIVGTRRRLNFVEGAGVTLTVTDDPANEEVDVTVTGSGGGSTNSGITTVNFGVFPGTTDTSKAVAGQASILSTSLVKVYIRPETTATHNPDDHWVDDLHVYAGDIVAGTGFTIYAKTNNNRLHGEYVVAWEWV